MREAITSNPPIETIIRGSRKSKPSTIPVISSTSIKTSSRPASIHSRTKAALCARGDSQALSLMLAARKSGQAKEPKASSLAYARSNGEIAAGETASMLASGTAQMRPEVRGIELDAQSRCAHYSSPLDIVAIKMKCCGGYFACKECHAALADHVLE